MGPYRDPGDAESKDLTPPGVYKPQRVGVSGHGMISTQHFLATEAGVRVLAEGGNAIDAAVAAAFALGVCEPAASGLGGQTMMLIHAARSRRTFALDGSSRAPNRTVVAELPRSARRYGYKATTVPSTPAVLAYALQRYGSMPLAAVIEPAVELAERGYRVSELQRRLSQRVRKHLQRGSAAQCFLKNSTRSFRVGERFHQPVLAETLRRLGRVGVGDFYTGEIAAAMCRDMARQEGLITREDLAQIPWPIERRPVSSHYEGLRLVTFPPPGAGRTLVELLNIVSHFPLKHRSVDGTVSLELSRMRSDIPNALRRHGFEIDERDPYSFYLGCVQATRARARSMTSATVWRMYPSTSRSRAGTSFEPIAARSPGCSSSSAGPRFSRSRRNAGACWTLSNASARLCSNRRWLSLSAILARRVGWLQSVNPLLEGAYGKVGV